MPIENKRFHESIRGRFLDCSTHGIGTFMLNLFKVTAMYVKI